MNDNTPPGSAQPDPPLTLRPAPRRVVRFKRRLVIGVAVSACTAVLGATWLALQAPASRQHSGKQELYDAERKPPPETLAGLPRSYDQIKPPRQLGAPLPGDLGPPVLRQERDLGISSAAPATLRPNPEEDAARAERLHEAQLARQAREAGVFFRLSQQDHGAAAQSAAPPAAFAAAPSVVPAAAGGNDRLLLDPEHDQNYQGRKLDFVGQQPDRSIYNPHSLQDPASPYEVLAGTVIAGSLLTGINSDLPGEVIAQVTENVYDTVTGRILLIPQGSRLIGTYDSVVAFGQSRALVVWQRIIMPDGSSMVIDNLPATDAAGYSGLEDQVDYHTWQLLKGVTLSTLLGVGTQATFGSQQSNLVQAIQQSAQQNINRAGQRIVEKDLNVQPTITIRPGWPLRIVVHKDLLLRPYRG